MNAAELNIAGHLAVCFVAELYFISEFSAVLVIFVISGSPAFKAAAAVESEPIVCATLLRTRWSLWLSPARSVSPATTMSLRWSLVGTGRPARAVKT